MNNSENKETPFFMQNYRLANLLISSFTFVVAVCVVLLNKGKNIWLHKVLPIAIISVVIFTVSTLFDVIHKHNYKYSWVRSLERQRKKKNDEEPESYNVYPIDPKLLERGLTRGQYEKLLSVRFKMFIAYLVINLLIILYRIDFDGHILLSIVLPIVMIAGAVGVVFVILDIIFEGLIKLFYKKKKTSPPAKNIDYSKGIYKNLRIYYIPICILIGIIFIIGIVDLTKSLKMTIIYSIVAAVVDVLFIIAVDLVASKIGKIKRYIDNTVNQDIDDDIFEMLDEKNPERNDENEI